MFNSTPAAISRFWSILGILKPSAFSVFLFCHPFEGRDSLKKRKIYEERMFAIPQTLQTVVTHSGSAIN